MRPAEITCPHVSPVTRQNCEAGEGVVCSWPDWSELGPPPLYHGERIELADSMDSNPTPVSKEAFEEAVLETVD